MKIIRCNQRKMMALNPCIRKNSMHNMYIQVNKLERNNKIKPKKSETVEIIKCKNQYNGKQK